MGEFQDIREENSYGMKLSLNISQQSNMQKIKICISQFQDWKEEMNQKTINSKKRKTGKGDAAVQQWRSANLAPSEQALAWRVGPHSCY